MTAAAIVNDATERETDFVQTAKALGPKLSERAEDHDSRGTFVADNYADLREQRLFSASIPTELGGGGASYRELCEVIRELGRHCGSTALAFAMHTHPVAVNVYRYLHGDEGAATTLRNQTTPNGMDRARTDRLGELCSARSGVFEARTRHGQSAGLRTR